MSHLQPDILATPNDDSWKCIFSSTIPKHEWATRKKQRVENSLSLLNHSNIHQKNLHRPYLVRRIRVKWVTEKMHSLKSKQAKCTPQSNTLNCQEVYCCFPYTQALVHFHERSFSAGTRSDFGAFTERLFVVWRRTNFRGRNTQSYAGFVCLGGGFMEPHGS